jgi:Ran GTPase-activating protein (RanGAP) involved in mRNA processing and transport
MGNELSEFQDLCNDLRAGASIDHVKASYLPTVFNDDHACDLSEALKRNSTVHRLDFNTAYLSSVGTRALGKTIQSCPNIRHVQLRYSRSETLQAHASRRQARLALQVLMEELEGASLNELYLVGTDLTHASKEFGKFLQNATSLKALRASSLPVIGASKQLHISQGLSRNNSIELVELYELPNAILDTMLNGLDGHAKLKWLAIDLEGGQVSDTTTLRNFLESPRNQSLEKLVWSRSLNMPLEPLFQSLKRNACIKILKIVDCTLSQQDAVQLKLMLRNNNTVQSLLLSCNHIDNDQFREIASGLYRNSTIKELDLANNHLHGLDASIILRSLLQRNRGIRQLDLSRNHFGGTQGMRSLTEGLSRNSTLHELVLSSLRIMDDDLLVLLSGLQLRSPLKAVALSNNLIGPTGVGHVIRVLQQGGVETVVLSNNRRIGSAGARLLATHLSTPECRLKVLCLDGTEMGDEGLQALASALEQNRTLEYLSIDDIFFSSAGLRSLAGSLPQMKKLVRLDFHWNPTLPESPPQELLDALRNNTSLVQVDITGLEPGPWKDEVLYYGIRNRYNPLLQAPDGLVPAGLWPIALEKLSKCNISNVAYHCLCSMLPWLLDNALTPPPSRKRKATSAAEA